MAGTKPDGPSAPSVATIKRLFAVSGNCCAFPKCAAALVVGEKVIGKICHIKAQREGGARYDPGITAEECHGFENLILMCGVHHDVIDDDEEAYTVEYLHRLKARHEAGANELPHEQAEAGARLLLLDQSVSSASQTGGITAHTVHVHNYAQAESATAGSQPNEPDDRKALFRGQDEPLGMHWNILPFSSEPDYEIFLSAGAALWFRLTPTELATSSEQSHQELLNCARGPSVPLRPLYWINMRYLRADDGVGVCATINPLVQESVTQSVAFAFTTGGIWCVDMSILQLSASQPLYFESIAKPLVEMLPLYAQFLRCLGWPPPYRWEAGLDGIKGRRFKLPPPPHHISIGSGSPFLRSIISAQGSYDGLQPPAVSLRPFFAELCRRSGSTIPPHIEQAIRGNRTS